MLLELFRYTGAHLLLYLLKRPKVVLDPEENSWKVWQILSQLSETNDNKTTFDVVIFIMSRQLVWGKYITTNLKP